MKGEDPMEQRVALVAGGSGEIGGAVAKCLARQNCRVYVGYNARPEAAQATVDQIAAEAGTAAAIQLEMQDSAKMDQVFESLFNANKRFDILVNCAAINVEAPALGMDDETWASVRAVNLDAAFYLCRAAGKYMLMGRWGRIINVSSIAASLGGRGQINYAASKAGLEGMTRVLALELGRKGVLANCIAPGIIETGMSERLRNQHQDKLLDTIAVRRFGSPKEVAAAIAFLASESAAFITGQVIRVDGGMGL